MQYEVEVGGRTRQVSVQRTGGVLTVTVDGRPWRVDAARIDGQTLSLILEDASSLDVTLSSDQATSGLVVRVGSTPVPVQLDGRRRRGRPNDGTGGSGPQRVSAPMPGKIVRVLVRKGDTVQPRQPLVVVEAMKMENELRAAREGTVTEVHAKEGASVDAGCLLVVIQ